MNYNIAKGFANPNTSCCIYKFNLPPDTPYLFIGYISKTASEYEIVLPAGCEFKIIAERKDGYISVYECNLVTIHTVIPQLDYKLEDIPLDYDTINNIRSLLNLVLNKYDTFKRLLKDNVSVKEKLVNHSMIHSLL